MATTSEVVLAGVQTHSRVSVNSFNSFSDKNLIVSINGDVDEARALSKPQEDSQGTNNNYTLTLMRHIFVVQLIFQLDSAVFGFHSF